MNRSDLTAFPRDALEVTLIDVTLEMISRSGIESLKVRDVAAAAGISPTSIYNRFGGKEGLIQAALKVHHGRVADNDQGPSMEELASACDEIFEIGQRYCRNCIESPSMAAAVMSIHYSLTNDLDKDTVFQQSSAAFLEVLGLAQKRGELRLGAVIEVIASELAEACHAVVFMWSLGRVSDAEFKARMLLRCATIMAAWVAVAIRNPLLERISEVANELARLPSDNRGSGG